MSCQREVSSFCLPPNIVNRLLGAGYRYNTDIDRDIRPLQFAKELGCSNQEALQTLKTIRGLSSNEVKGKSAFELLHQETQLDPVVTFNSGIDEMLGGGVPRGKITEFCGVPGVGKTQMGLQLAVDVHIPQSMGGAEGRCVYIDTEGSFVPERVREMAVALVEHLTDIVQNSEELLTETTKIPTPDDILEHIYYYRVHDYIEQIALMHQLPFIVQSDPLIKLVIIDSVAFHFRHEFENMSLRTRLLNGMAQSLLQLANTMKLAVVLINQVTTKVDEFKPSMLVPALGESWGHTVPYRVMLYWENGVRYAHLYKSPQQQAATVPYQITEKGVRDLIEQNPEPDSNEN